MSISARASLSFSRVAAVLVALVGGVALLGWMLDLPLLTHVVVGDVAMPVNAALAFVFCGLSLAWFNRKALGPIQWHFGQAAALIVAAIGLITLAQTLFGWNAGIDQLLLRNPSGVVASASAGQMGPNTALGFLLAGAALLILHRRSGWWLAQALTSAATLVALIALIGYIYGVPFSFWGPHSVAMTAPTAFTFLVLCAGIFTATPDHALGEIVGNDHIGGDAARRLLPIAIILPPLLGWLTLTGQRAGIYDTEHGVAILVTAVVTLAAAAVIWVSRILNGKHAERLHAQSALHVIDARFRATFEQAAVGIAHVAPDGRWLRVNQKACDIFGYSQAELQSRTCHEITHPDDLIAEREHIQHMLEGNVSTYAMEKRCVRKDGSIVWVNQTVSQAHTPDGAVDYFITVTKDIDERVAAQLQMRKLWSAIEQSVEIVSIHDRNGIIEYVNPAFETITGYASTQVIGRTDNIVKSGQHDQAFYARLWDTVLRGEVFRAVFINRRKDGTLYHEEKTITPLRDGTGMVTHFVATGKDITARVDADKALLQSEQYNRRLFETASIGLAVSHMDGRLIDVNPAYARLIGRSVEEMVQLTRWQITPEKYHQQDIVALEQLRDTGHYDAYEKEYIHRDGHLVPVRMSGVTLENNGEPYIWSSVEDVTERKQAELRIKHLNRMYALLSAINQMLVHVRDRDEILSESCRIAVEVGGFDKAWIGLVKEQSTTVRVVAWHGTDEFFAGLQDRLDGIAAGGEGILPTVIADKQAVVSNDVANDRRVNLRASIVASESLAIAVFPMLVDGEVVAVLSLHANEIGYFNDDELKLLGELTGDMGFALEHLTKTERIDFLSSYDALTGLPNRQLFAERLTAHIESTTASESILAVVLMDLERFRHVNETLGREGGDALLCAVATRLQQVNASATRLGNDRFCLMLVDRKSASDIAHGLEELEALCFAAPYAIAGQDLRIGCRFGVSVFPGDGDSAEILLKNAEAALRRGRQSTEHCVFYAPDMNARAAHAMALESKLRRAIEQQEFVLHYQPKVNFSDGRICGVEALIRWQDPEHGLLPPAGFISVLEESGLIATVGSWVLKQAMSDRRKWIDAGLAPLCVSVNVSTLQFQQIDFARQIGDLVANEDRDALELEITESVVIEDVERTIAMLKEIRDHGVRIAVDDFGTGYSSLAYIAKLPITALKVDRAFVMAMTEGPEGWVMASSIVALARALKLKSVAEGVETEEQIRLLRLLGCDEGQGYYYCKPVPADDILNLLTAGGILPVRKRSET